MTRFARAKGSKASNERVEEEATPWDELKPQTVAPKKQHYNVEDFDEDDVEIEQNDENETAADSKSESEDEKEPEQGLSTALADSEEVGKKKKRKRAQNKCLNCKEPGHLKKECPQLSDERRKELQDLYQMKIERKGKGTGRKKKKRKLDEVLDDGSKQSNENEEPKSKKAKKNKNRDKVVKDKTGQAVKEGEGLFQGFRVLQEDVQRLRDLHAKLSKAKVTPNEMKEVLKKERRKAEKMLANSIKNVCYHCRESGHRLGDCPKMSAKMGKCFKCGSEDHTSKNCQSKLTGADAYRFADCFVCGQKGHLAKACPDNPKGLYPNGGGCRFCGSVEHLKSECPRKAVKDAKTNVFAKKQSSNNNIEEEEDLSRPTKKQFKMSKPQKKKVVTF